MRSVAVVPAVGLLAGSAVGLLVPHVTGPSARVVFVLCVLVACLACRMDREWLVVVGTAAGFAAGGALVAADAWQRAWRPPIRQLFEDLASSGSTAVATVSRPRPRAGAVDATISGVLASDAVVTDGGVSLAIDVDGVADDRGDVRHGLASSAGGVVVTVSGTLARDHLDEWRAGRRVRVPVQLRRPSIHRDPGVPDGERALARRGITLVGSVKSGALVELVARGSGWSEAVGFARLFARSAINRAVGHWSARSAAIVSAIVIGDRAGLDQDVQRQLQEAGTYHVIAISGGNIAILAGLLLSAFKRVGVPSRAAMLVAIATLLAYADLAGGGASVERATWMAVLACGGRALDHRSAPLNTLSVAAAALVVANPLLVADTAFVLTCGATLAILVAASSGARHQSRRVLGAAATLGIASLAVETLLFPIGALAFSRVTFAGLGLNFIAIPLMAVTQIAGMAIVPLALVSRHLADVAGWVAHISAAGLLWSASLVEMAPGLAYRVPPPGWTSVCLYYASLALVWLAWRTGLRRVSGAAAVLALLSGAWILTAPWTWPLARGDGRLHVSFLDVGQGDSVFIRFPRGKTMLVDAGGLLSSSFDIGDRVVGPALRALGVRRLDFVVLSHGDPDHIGGAASVIRDFRPREVWEGIPVPAFAPLEQLKIAAGQAGARWANVYAGDAVEVDQVSVAVRHPMPADWQRRRVRNDDSLVLELLWRDVTVVLAGDIGAQVETGLIPAMEGGTRLRVLKVPHHGSLTSSSWPFLRALGPQVAVASAGRDNRFGHPASDVVARYERIGAAVFRTDEDGLVTLDTDGSSIDVRGFTGRHVEVLPDGANR